MTSIAEMELDCGCPLFHTLNPNIDCGTQRTSSSFLEFFDLAPVALGGPALEKERLRL